ncbi:MAG: hypothetical protein LBG83_09275 [Oscillospiraceae bacterium]|jgi:hypothetical protein|nr:hypothetical protein [Oscillospiraceae bacterium]
MHYANNRHARRYRSAVRGKTYSPRTLAALFLLTADHRLWPRWRAVFAGESVDWQAARRGEVSWGGYFLECAALSIARCGHPQVTLHDLTDQANYPQETLRIVITALWIARNDPRTIIKFVICKGGKLVTC